MLGKFKFISCFIIRTIYYLYLYIAHIQSQTTRSAYLFTIHKRSQTPRLKTEWGSQWWNWMLIGRCNLSGDPGNDRFSKGHPLPAPGLPPEGCQPQCLGYFSLYFPAVFPPLKCWVIGKGVPTFDSFSIYQWASHINPGWGMGVLSV